VTRSDEAVKLLVDDGLPLLHRIARHVFRRYNDLVDYDELVSIGYEGLHAAARTFDSGFGVPFQRYAWRRIHGFIMNRVNKHIEYAYAARMREAGSQAVALLDDAGTPSDDDARQTRSLTQYCDAVAAAMAMSGAASGAMATAGIEVDDAMHLRDLSAQLDVALGEIDDAQAHLLRAHYQGGVELKQLAGELGVSYRTIRRRHNEALHALGSAIRAPNPQSAGSSPGGSSTQAASSAR
jgi:RNA polymerase sigma factor (sigma-70 family)